MSLNLSPIIQASELLKLYQAKDVVIFDVSNGKDAQLNYANKHLTGALFIDLNTQLADIKDDFAKGGRHPLPKIEDFAKTLSDFGISKTSHVILYDDKNGSNASARLWWMLKAIGHEKVQVLNGGIQAAEKVGFPMSSKTETINKASLYEFDTWKLPIAEIDEVESASQSKNHIVVDVRDAERYRGETEPIDLIAGHIPGAINIPFTENLDENGLFLDPNQLKLKYEAAFAKTTSENIIVHCGSGVTACHSLLAIAYAGLEIPKLYVGSWSEWSRNHKKIATNL
ncbi:MAG: sulfurtransferase [Sphingobacteriales bacterium]|nr:sulfurtransferase [Sphingobacteriales bacterium]